MIVELAPEAAVDLQAAADFLKERNPSAAGALLLRFAETMALLSGGIVRGRSVTLKDGTRVLAWSMAPYKIYYRLETRRLAVLRVFHQARRPIERKHRKP